MLRAEAISRGGVLQIAFNNTTSIFPGGEVHIAVDDSFGFAVKATAGTVNGEFRELQKDPVTDSGTKKSACGYIRVEEVDGEFVQFDRQTRDQMEGGALEVVFRDGNLKNRDTFSAIRKRLGAL